METTLDEKIQIPLPMDDESMEDSIMIPPITFSPDEEIPLPPDSPPEPSTPPLPPPPPPSPVKAKAPSLKEQPIKRNKTARWGSRDVSAFEIIEQVGEGTYGEVFKARCKETMTVVALKKIRMDKEREGFPITAIREIKILKSLNHENIVQLKEIVTSKGEAGGDGGILGHASSVYLVFEYLEHDLSGLLSTKSVQFGQVRIKCYMKQLLDGVAYMHKQKILHRDIKGSNLLLDNKGRLKIADWGLARPWSEGYQLGYTNNVITLWYRPPELLLGEKHYGLSVDMWSVGCLMAELLFGRAILPGENEMDQLRLIYKLLGTPTTDTWPGYTKLPKIKTMDFARPLHGDLKERFQRFSPEALDLVQKLLTLDPSKRLTAAEALEHDYFWVEPRPCKPNELPKFNIASVHEYQAKKESQAKRMRPDRGARAAPADRQYSRASSSSSYSGHNNSHHYRPYHHRGKAGDEQGKRRRH